ncbi:MAG: type III pantothenate kinase [Candidatus Omnitrophica bacterium]|nr:type III pantothenate kinase [Candidatus Omnitrophota bacterium]
MFLAIDIGNSNIAIGAFKRKKLIKKVSLSTALYRKPALLCKELKKVLAPCKGRVTEAIICSVVPPASKVVAKAVEKDFAVKPLLLGKDIGVPIKNLYKRPGQVGQDRLVNAYACLKQYGKPAIIIDFGTATTFDYLTKAGDYAGGLITPGVEISLDALAKRAEMLPRIELKKPKRLIGKDTEESMRSGVLYGLSAMCDGLISKIKKKYPGKTVVVATGGLAPFFASYCRNIDHVDPHLTLTGINLLKDSL